MSTIEVEVYETFDYDELDESAQESAFVTWRDNQQEWDWIEENIDSMKQFADHFDINLKNWSLGGQGDYVYFSIDGNGLSDMEYVRLWKYIKNHNYENVTCAYVDKNTMKTTTIRDSCPFTGYCMDDTLLDNIREFIGKPYKTTFYDLIDSCFDKWLKACHDEMEYQQSEECFKEYANEYKYLDDGTQY